MYTNVSYAHGVVLISYVVITIAALLSVWRSRDSIPVKLIWTIAIIALPYLGGLLWAVNLLIQKRRTVGS